MTHEPQEAAEEAGEEEADLEEADLDQIPGFWLLGLLSDITFASHFPPVPAPSLESGQTAEKRTQEDDR